MGARGGDYVENILVLFPVPTYKNSCCAHAFAARVVPNNSVDLGDI